MDTVLIHEFRANMEQLLKKVQSGETIIIMDHGQPIARLCPVEDTRENARKALKKLAKTAVVGDVVSPLHESWEAMK
ncbi:MAG: type II toxin-antitoxin system prevent-host-death family antitoxin [candidate division KSB1 bacterium]|nr:type II toxin-antitoxin system prevent-host-death family antitoxin [candidate division KSB1 bacterium]MDQ7064138.1 type II toxin-antitoxin system prevent-host-death family antitoxin [candidate division KSB1 bacterium]